MFGLFVSDQAVWKQYLARYLLQKNKAQLQLENPITNLEALKPIFWEKENEQGHGETQSSLVLDQVQVMARLKHACIVEKGVGSSQYFPVPGRAESCHYIDKHKYVLHWFKNAANLTV